MQWVLDEYNKRNAEQHELRQIDQKMSSIWGEVVEAISETIGSYRGLPGAMTVEHMSSSPDTVDMTFHGLMKPSEGIGALFGRATIVLDRKRRMVVVTYLDGSTKEFPFVVARNQVSLSFNNRPIDAEEFTKLALSEVLFG